MSLRVISAGVQATLQGRPRAGARRLAAPMAGPADALSMALANRLVGEAPHTTAIEITLGGFEAETMAALAIGLGGAEGAVWLDDRPAPLHRTLHLGAGARLRIDPPKFGVRTYLAIAGGFAADEVFGSPSTYIPAGWGGHKGRALQAGDVLDRAEPAAFDETIETPLTQRPVFGAAFALRACPSAETSLLTAAARAALFGAAFTVSRRTDRMGVRLDGARLDLETDGRMKSGAVYPGVIQCPEDGAPIALLCDAQTTGGYPRIASVARGDRHLLGQLRAGASVRFLLRTREEALADLRGKAAYLGRWLPDFRL